MSTTWELLLEDLERSVAEVLAAVEGDSAALERLQARGPGWVPPATTPLPAEFAPRVEALLAEQRRANNLLAQHLRSLKPQRDITRRLVTNARRPAYVDTTA